ncbi:DUF3108 domain-containing protein [Robertkochia solimangrovi]|uniref:DUF3108 domain-containing protein n=1 Tax=Robertkochia solimangrovi TaxID=2213046 RepID=UPI00117FC15A|nr:DUF3108 domain-containing protein [Robertkochia solimangrovi]TRZ46435.1 DUF3108 domain-containing protein [Robertkochia solimangrovi]
MRKIIPVILIFLLTSFAYQNEEPVFNSSFQGGEWFQFRIHYGVFNASYATLELKDEMLKGKSVYHVVGKGKTTGLARWFFAVDDNYESYFDKQDGKPYRFIRQIDEGGYTKDLEINFNHQDNEAVVTNHKHGTTKTIETNNEIQDLLSAFYFLRENYQAEDLKVGEEIILDLLYDDDKPFRFKLKFLGREEVNTKFGNVNCLKFRPYVQSGRVFKEEESLTLWVSDDKNKVPIRIKADLMIGSLKADLEAFKGLKHQFKIKVD